MAIEHATDDIECTLPDGRHRWIFRNCKPLREHIETVVRLKKFEEESQLTSHIITELPPPQNAPLQELRDYAARHGLGRGAYLLTKRQLSRLLYRHT
jgi:hypothetical protein